MTLRLWFLALGVLPALGEVGSTAIYTDFQEPVPAAVIAAMREEVAAIMGPGGLHFEWRSLSRVTGSEVFTELAVAKFLGRCDGERMEPGRFEAGALAWSHITDGEVLPFTDVDCNRISSFLRPRLAGMDVQTRQRIFGRAVGRVLAHELFHIFTRSKGHGTRNVDKPYYSAADLVTDRFKAGQEFHILSSVRKGPATLRVGLPEAGLATYERTGCVACHGWKAQGSKFAPALRAGKRWLDAVILAARLDRGSEKMSRRAKNMGILEPSLTEEDLDGLVRFLNGLD